MTDFGLAKLVGHDDLTASGDVIGTLRYLAPEALQGTTDHRSDVYSLGLTLYELLTLSPPFGDLSPSELLRHVSEGRPLRPRSFDPAIPRDLETIVLKAIARDPTTVTPARRRLADDLKSFLDDRPAPRPAGTPPERLWRWSRRHRAIAASTAVAVGSLVLAAVVGWAGYVSTTRALRRADDNVALSLAVFGELFDKLAPHDDSLPPAPGRHAPRPLPPNRPPDGPNRRDDSASDTALLQSVLTFYEQFAQRNATNPQLESEAARLYIPGSDGCTIGSVEALTPLPLTTAPARCSPPSPRGFRPIQNIPRDSSKLPSWPIPGQPIRRPSNAWNDDLRGRARTILPAIERRSRINCMFTPSLARSGNASAGTTRQKPVTARRSS